MKVVNEKKEEVELCSSVECKGIIGNDGRHYILDLLRYRYLSSSNFYILAVLRIRKQSFGSRSGLTLVSDPARNFGSIRIRIRNTAF